VTKNGHGSGSVDKNGNRLDGSDNGDTGSANPSTGVALARTGMDILFPASAAIVMMLLGAGLLKLGKPGQKSGGSGPRRN